MFFYQFKNYVLKHVALDLIRSKWGWFLMFIDYNSGKCFHRVFSLRDPGVNINNLNSSRKWRDLMSQSLNLWWKNEDVESLWPRDLLKKIETTPLENYYIYETITFLDFWTGVASCNKRFLGREIDSKKLTLELTDEIVVNLFWKGLSHFYSYFS